MIHSIKFSNFYSFKDETVFDLTWTKKDSIDDTVSKSKLPGIHVSRVAAVLGANASGKTNLLRTIGFMKYWIVDAWNLPPETPVNNKSNQRFGPVPFRFLDSENPKQHIECIFETERAIYKVELILKNGFAISEVFSEQSKTKHRTTWKTLFSRENTGEREKEDIRDNASLIFTKSRYKNIAALDILDFWSRVNIKILPLNLLRETNFDANRVNALKAYANNPEALNYLNSLLVQLDHSHLRLEIETVRTNDGNFQITAGGKVKIDDKEYKMEFYSDGTLKLIDFAYLIYDTIRKGGVLVFDEFETTFHPELVNVILGQFKDKSFNHKGAQIIFSTNNPQFIIDMNRYQIFFLEKNEHLGSDLNRLDSFKGVRPKDNYYAKYIAGAYGAVPSFNSLPGEEF